MSRCRWLSFVLVAAASVAAQDSGSPRPNVVVILADDQGWADVGYHNAEVRTPNLDALARAGVELDAHYVQPQCTPTRVALMTGRYPSRFGPQATQASNAPSFPIGTLTMARMFQQVGYETALMGKWHMGSTVEHGPKHHGFDHSYGSLAGAVGMYDHRYRLKTPFARTWHRNHEWVEEEGHVTDLVAAEAIRFIEREREKPFFLYLPFHAVHTPIVERDERWAKANEHIEDPDRRAFLAAMTHLDDAVGRIVEAIRRQGQLDNTILLYSSDNGGIHTGYRGGNYPPPDPKLAKGFSSNAPLRGGKTTAYEGGMRVPAFVVWPDRLEPRRVRARMHIVDWLPTLAGVVGYRSESDPQWDGVDLWSLWSGERAGYSEPRSIYTVWGGGRNQEALHVGDWKIVRRRRGKAQGPWQLFDLSRDPGEKSDLAEQQPEQVERLSARFAEIRKGDRLRKPGGK